MNGLVTMAWRGFWVGLGAALVLVGQSLLASPPEVAPEDVPVAPQAAPPPRANPPVLSRTSWTPSSRRST